MKKKYTVLILTLVLVLLCVGGYFPRKSARAEEVMAAAQSENYIKYVDFTPTRGAMLDCIEYDVSSFGSGEHIDWVTLLAILASDNYGNFDSYKKSRLEDVLERIKQGGVDGAVKNRASTYTSGKEKYSKIYYEYPEMPD